MKMNNKHIYISIVIMLICLTTNAQTDKGLIRHGNNEFKNGNFSEAEVNYRKSLDKEYNPKAQFNLGDALYEQKNYEDAQKKILEFMHNHALKNEVVNGKVIDSDMIRINLSNEDCHLNLKPSF